MKGRLRYALSIVMVTALFLLTSCADRPFGYILSPLETAQASGWTATPTLTPTATRRPTNTPRPSLTPKPSATATPTKRLPLNVSVDITNQLSVGLSVHCTGPYVWDKYVAAYQTETVHIPAGAYSCVLIALGYNNLYTSEYWSTGSWEWTIHEK